MVAAIVTLVIVISIVGYGLKVCLSCPKKTSKLKNFLGVK